MTATWRSLLAVTAVSALAWSSAAAAQDRFGEAIGGNGGKPFQLRCPGDQHLTGVVGYTGAYFDGIAPICDGGAQDAAGTTKRKQPTDARCPNGSWVARIDVYVLYSANRLVDSLKLWCRTRDANTGSVSIFTTEGAANSKSGTGIGRMGGTLSCDQGYIAVGLQGAAGVSIDRIGLICELWVRVGSATGGRAAPMLPREVAVANFRP